MAEIQLQVNGRIHTLAAHPHTPLLYILRQDMGLKSPKHGYRAELCGACKVLVDRKAAPNCRLPACYTMTLCPTRPAALIVAGTAVDDPIPPAAIPPEATQTLRATYHRPYHMYAALSPSAAVAYFHENK